MQTRSKIFLSLTKVSNSYIKVIDIVHQINRGNKEKIQDYVFLRATIKTRIEEMNEFYEANINDPKIHYLEKYKLKLKQWLHLKWQSQAPAEFNTKAARRQEEAYSHSGRRGTYEYQKDEDLNEREELPDPVVDRKAKRALRPPSFSGPDVGQDGFASRHSQAAKSQITPEAKAERPMVTPPKEQKGKGEWKELIFRIKLTPEEYSLYLHEKSKRL